MNSTEALGIIVATIVALILRWSADRWPGKKDSATRRADRLTALQEQVEIKRLERELKELGEEE